MGHKVERASEGAQQAWTRTRDAVGSIRERLDIEGRVERHPFGTLAAAVGIGYVLGGGLFTRFTGRFLGLGLKIGVRLAVLPFIKDELADVVDTLVAGEGGDAGEDGGKPRSRHATRNATTKGKQS